MNIYCDGVLKNNCTAAVTTAEHTLHRMMNWDYGTIYTGPYNARDTSYMGQKISVHDNYLQVDVQMINTGAALFNALEIPTFCFNNRFRRYHYPSDTGQVVTENIPVNLEGLDAANIRRTYNPSGQLEWISFENTGLSSFGYYITIATFYSDAFVEDQATQNTHLWEIEEGHYYDNIKFTNAPGSPIAKTKHTIFVM